ncbi:MAG: hypothetical protein WCP07_00595 [bacterium]
MNKKVTFGTKPQSVPNAEEWINGNSATIAAVSEIPAAERGTTKRLTFDVTTDLHTRIKVQCAMKGVKVADELRLLLEAHFPPGNGNGKS